MKRSDLEDIFKKGKWCFKVIRVSCMLNDFKLSSKSGRFIVDTMYIKYMMRSNSYEYLV
jgi:hypothetical protein